MRNGEGVVDQHNTSGGIPRVGVLVCGDNVPRDGGSLVVAILVSAEPEHLSGGLRHPDAEVEKLVVVIREEAEVSDSSDVLLHRAVPAGRGRLGLSLVDDGPPVGRLLDADGRQMRRQLDREVGGADRVVAAVVPDAQRHDGGLADLRLSGRETHVRVRAQGGGEDDGDEEIELHCKMQEWGKVVLREGGDAGPAGL